MNSYFTHCRLTANAHAFSSPLPALDYVSFLEFDQLARQSAPGELDGGRPQRL